MKRWFPWLRKTDHTAERETAAQELSKAQDELRKSQDGLRAAKLEQHNANQLARELRHIRAKNHFGEAIERAYKNNHA